MLCGVAGWSPLVGDYGQRSVFGPSCVAWGWVVGSWGGSPWSLRGGEAVEDGGFGFLAVGGVGALDDFHGGEGGPVLEVGGALQEVAAVALRLEEDLEQAGVEGVAGSADAELDRGAGSDE